MKRNRLLFLLISVLLLLAAGVIGTFGKGFFENTTFSRNIFLTNQNRYGTLAHADILEQADTTMPKSLEDSILKCGYKIISSLPAGYVTDGTIDYTRYIQEAIDKHSLLLFPAFPLLINDNGLQIRSNKYLYFPKGSRIILSPSMKGNYNVISIKDSKNVVLINPIIYGDRYQHLGTTGEWGMGIGIYSSENIIIYNPKVSGCWGDGIYFGVWSNNIPCRNIYISNAWCYNNRRNGISIISADKLQLINPYAGYSNGTLPMAGIDIEPDDNNDFVRDISILNPITEFNKGDGISISLSELLGKRPDTIGVVINNQVDTGSNRGCYISCLKAKGKQIYTSKSNLSGTVQIINPHWKASKKEYFNAYGFMTNDVQLKIINPVISDKTGFQIKRQPAINLIQRNTDNHANLLTY